MNKKLTGAGNTMKHDDDIFKQYRNRPTAELRDRIYAKYSNIALRSARSMSSLYRNIPLDDLHQHARIGLWKAIERYNPEKGVPFSIYAMISCKNAIKEELRKEDPIPRRIQSKKKQLEKITDSENINIEEAMLEIGLTHKQYVAMVVQYQASQHKSIDDEHNDKVKSKTNLELKFMKKEEMEELTKALRMLSDREQMLIQSLFLKGNTKARTASIFVKSIKSVRYEESKALEKLYYAIHIIRNNFKFTSFKLGSRCHNFSIEKIAEKCQVHRRAIYHWQAGHTPQKKIGEKLVLTIMRMAKSKKNAK
jgi:RNA polymerase sigma factor (sigma-70 family)